MDHMERSGTRNVSCSKSDFGSVLSTALQFPRSGEMIKMHGMRELTELVSRAHSTVCVCVEGGAGLEQPSEMCVSNICKL